MESEDAIAHPQARTLQNKRCLHFLLLEDNADDAELTLHALRRAEFDFTCTVVDSRQTFLEALTAEVDMVFADYTLPDVTGIEAIELTNACFPGLPVMIVSGTIGEEMAVEIMRKGAADYFLKDRMSRLGAAVTQALEKRRADEALTQTHEHYRALIDAVPQIVWTADPTGHINYINTQWQAYSGCTLEETRRRGWSSFLHPDDHASSQQSWQNALLVRQPFHLEYRLLRQDGVYRWFLARGVPGKEEQEQSTGWYGTFTDIDDQKRAEEAVRASEERFRALIEYSADIVSIIEADGNVRYQSPTGKRVGGYEQAERIGQSAMANIHPEDLSRAHAIWQSALEKPDEAFISEMRLRHKDGSWHHAEVTLRNLLANPAIGGLVVNTRDITQRKLTEQAMRESDQELRTLMESMPQIVWKCRPDGWNIYFNQRWANYTGLRDTDSAGYGWWQAFHPDDKDATWEAWKYATHTGDIYECECRIRQSDGDYRWFLMRGLPLCDVAGKITQWFGTCTDIHDRKMAEVEQDRFFTLSLDMLCIARADGYFKRMNPAFETTLGYSSAEFMAASYLEFVHPEDRAATLAEGAKLAGGQPTLQFVNRYRCKDGTYRWLSWRTAPFGDLLYAVAHDITPLKEAEAALREVNEELEIRVQRRTASLETMNSELSLAKQEADRANKAKSEFLSRMSHELRTPLNAILGFGQILERRDLNGIEKESIHYILRGGRHLLTLINEVLDLARIEAGHLDLSLESVALPDVIAQASELVRPLAETRAIRLADNAAASGGLYVQADNQRLKQVLINLLSNAIKYNRPGGEVEITAQRLPNGRIRISVHDTGHGISQEDLLRLFTPFERLGVTDVEGTGLGLVLSHRLMEAMDGTLEVTSQQGKGSVFSLELPTAPAPGETDSAVLTKHKDRNGFEPAEGVYTVLTIEDNLSNLRLMEVILAGRPEITLLAAMQGSMGLDLARQHLPHLILLDLNLPDISGKEVLSQLQNSESTSRIPVVVISADATPSQRERLLEAGARAYLTKPLDVAEFLRTIEALLVEKQAL